MGDSVCLRNPYSIEHKKHQQALKGRVLATWLPRATLLQGPLEAFLSEGCFPALLRGRSWPRWASLRVVGPDVGPLARLSLVVVDDVVVGGRGVGLCLLAFLALGDDDGASISSDVGEGHCSSSLETL